MISQPTNILVSGVELNYARLDTPQTPLPGMPEVWEVQLSSNDRSAFAAVEEAGGTVKEKEGKFILQARRKVKRKDGSEMAPVRVVDANKSPLGPTERRKIGGGSTGNVILWAAPYEYMGRKGVTLSLTAVQITNLVEYNGGGGGELDFDIIGGGEDKSADF